MELGLILPNLPNPWKWQSIILSLLNITVCNVVEYGTTNGTSSANINLLLFARADNMSGKVKAEFYYMKIYDKSTNKLVRDFIPVEDINGVICLYDKVTKQFFYNIGSGTFVAGLRK